MKPGRSSTHQPGLGESLRERMRGTVLYAGDAGYDEARGVFNGRFDRRPAAVARCASVALRLVAWVFRPDCGLRGPQGIRPSPRHLVPATRRPHRERHSRRRYPEIHAD